MNTKYRVGEFSIELARTANGLAGIGVITHDGTPLRSGQYPWLPEFESAEGHIFGDWRLHGAEATDENFVSLRFRATGRKGWRSPQRNCYFDSCINPASTGAETVEADVSLDFTADTWLGMPRLRHRIRLNCPHADVRFVIERSTLEPNGTTEGARYFAPRWGCHEGGWEQALNRDDAFSTRDTLFIKGQPHVTGDLQPRGGGGPAMDFVYTPGLALFRFREEITLVRGYTGKSIGKTVLDIVDQSFFTPGAEKETPWVSLVVAPSEKPLTNEQSHDLWARVWDAYCGGIEDSTGVRRPDPVPSIIFESWNMRTGRFFEHQTKFLRSIAETGAKRVALHTLPHPHHGNNCCGIYDFTLPESEGGMEALRNYCEAAHQHGLEVYGWAAGHLHVSSPLLKEHPDWIVRHETPRAFAAEAHPFGGGYSEIVAMDFAHPGFQRAYIDWMLAMRGAGIDGFWIDSLINLHFYGVHMRRPPEHGGPGPHLHGLLHCLKTLSEAGLRFLTEGISPLGLSAGNIGFQPLDSSQFMGFLLADALNCGERGLYRTTLWARGRDQAGGKTISADRYFRCLANAAPPALFYDSSDHRLSDESTLPLDPPVAIPGYAAMNRAYTEVLPLLGQRQLLDDDAGVLWHPPPPPDAPVHPAHLPPSVRERPGPRVLFAYRDGVVHLPFAAECTWTVHDPAENKDTPRKKAARPPSHPDTTGGERPGNGLALPEEARIREPTPRSEAVTAHPVKARGIYRIAPAPPFP